MATFPISSNVAAMKGSSTLIAAQMAAELRAKGVDVIDLSVGEPDFDTPDFIKQLATEGLDKGLTKYTAIAGTSDYRKAVNSFYERRFGASLPLCDIAASCGGKQALFNAACSLLNPGDDVLIAKPFWVTFPEIVTFCRANPVFIETEETQFVLTADQVAASITEKTRLLILNSPSNPSGRVIPSGEMRRIVEVCADRGVYVLTDECYLFFAYPPSEPYTLAVLPPELREYVCVAGSFSKTFAMTGWRIGYTIANETWTKAMALLQSHSATHPTSFVQYACSKALQDMDLSMAAVEAMTQEYERRRDWFIPALNGVEGFECAMPEGAFYAFVNVRNLLGGELATSAAVVSHLLTEGHIVSTDGAGFGADGFVRLSYATSMENLQRAVDVMKEMFGVRSKAAA